MVIPRPSPLTSGQPLLTNSYLVQSTLVCTYSTVREPQKQPTSRFERWARIVYATRSITGYPPEPPPPAAATAAATIFQTVHRLLEAHRFEQILNLESKYRNLETFSDEPAEDIYVLYAFGRAIRKSNANSEDEICANGTIHYYERAKERIDAVNDQSRTPRSLRSEIGMWLALLYSDGRDVEKAIPSHRWLLEDCNRHEVSGPFLISLGKKFNQFGKYEYAIEVLEGSMHMMKTFEEEVQAETNLISTYIGCCEFRKAKAANEERRSTNINHWAAGLQSGRVEEGLCNHGAAIAQFREVVLRLCNLTTRTRW